MELVDPTGFRAGFVATISMIQATERTRGFVEGWAVEGWATFDCVRRTEPLDTTCCSFVRSVAFFFAVPAVK
jgi:hypothetical protein